MSTLVNEKLAEKRATGGEAITEGKIKSVLEACIKMASIHELDDLFNHAIDSVCEIFEADGGSIMLVDKDSGELAVRVAKGTFNNIVVGKRLKLGERFAGRVAQMRQPLLMHDVEDEDWFKSLEKYEEIKSGISVPILSGMSVPILAKGELIGTLNLKRTEREEKFTKGHVEIVTLFAGYLAWAIVGIEMRQGLTKALAEAREGIEELEKFSKVAVGRELQMVELKERIEELEAKLKEK